MKKITNILFSIPFGGALMLVIAASIGTATFIENDFGTIAAKTIVYNATWFEILLLVTAVSLLGSIFRYKLYQRRKFSVFAFHFAFIIILTGAAITRYFGYEGVMTIREGETSDRIVSDDTFLQLDVVANGEKYHFEEKILFSQFGNKNFDKTYHFDNEEVEIAFREFIPSAAQAVIEDPDGIPIISVVTVDSEGRKNNILEYGEQLISGDLSISFGQEATAGASVFITLQNDSLYFFSPYMIVKSNMMAGSKDTLYPGSDHLLETMMLYTLGSEQFVIRKFYPGARIGLVSAEPEPGFEPVDAIKMMINHKDASEEIYLIGGKGFMGEPEKITIDGTDFSLSYGAKYIDLPFAIKLKDFQLERYPGSRSPSSFASEVVLIDHRKGLEMPYRIFMNNVLNYGGYRFFQSSYDKDEKGTILSVNHDAWGTFVTYAGYVILVAGLLLNFFSKSSRFRTLARASGKMRKLGRSATVLIILLIIPVISPLESFARQEEPAMNIDKEHAESFGRLLVQDNDGRIKPLNTLSSEVLRKVSRKEKIQGLTSDQVLLGMMVFSPYWQSVPFIKVSDPDLKNILGISGKYASFNDFIDMESGRYKLSSYIDIAYNKKPGSRNTFDKDIIKVDERVNICFMIYSGGFLRIFPRQGDENNTWYSSDEAPDKFDTVDAGFVKNILPLYLNTVREAASSGNWEKADEYLGYIKLFQKKYGEAIYPSPFKVFLELLYNKINIFKRLFPYYGLLGFILLMFLFINVINPRYAFVYLVKPIIILIIIGFAAHTLGLAARWYISGHAPWSDGYETMIYIAWGVVLSGLIFTKRSKIALATTAVLASLTLMVANMSWLDPEITNLVPVLKSYWLVIHVAVITASYSFLGIGALLGFLNLILMNFQTKNNYKQLDLTIKELTNINEMNLIIGVFLITTGTFLGAVWANESWGRYWGWDPKETWALVTVLVYSFVVHMRLIPGLKGLFAFNFASLIAFSSVLMTYFGVNYYLSGLHSYAKGDPVPVPGFVYYAIAIVAVVSVMAYINHSRQRKLSNSIPVLFLLIIISISSCNQPDKKSRGREPAKHQNIQEVSENNTENKADTINFKAMMARGEEIYRSKCVVCHMVNGEGIKGTFPPLANSDYLLADKVRAAEQVLNGSNEKMIVNGEVYQTYMPPQVFTKMEAVAVVNYILNSWGNNGGIITLADVEDIKIKDQ